MPTIITFGQLASQAFGAMRRRLDRYFSNVVLLLTGRPVSGYSYIKDASTNNYAITSTGTVNSSRLNPLLGSGYYSNFFNGASNNLVLTTTNGVLDQNSVFTLEYWVFLTSVGSNQYITGLTSNSTYNMTLFNSSGNFAVDGGAGVGTKVTSASTFAINVWHHVALCYDGTTSRLFVDGGFQGSFSGGGPAAPSNALTISNFGSSSYMTGYVSNLRFVKGTALYTTNFVPPTSPLTAIAGTTLLTCQSNRIADNSIYNNTPSITGTVTVVPQTPFAVVNASGYYSGLFNGTSQYLSTPSASNLIYGNNNWTIEFWVYHNSIKSFNGYTSKRAGGTFGGVCLQSDSSGTLTITISTAAGSWVNSGNVGLFSNAFSANAWYHVAVVRNGSTITGYVNGVAGSTPLSIGSSSVYDTGSSFYVGSADGNSTDQILNGYLSNFRFVNGTAVYTANFNSPTVPLTAITNTALLTCQNPGFIDASTNAFQITSTGSPLIVSTNPFTVQTNATGYYSGYFNGSAYITTPYNSAFQVSGDMTIEFWINFSTSFTNAGIFQFDGFSGYGITIDTSRWVVSWLGANIIVGTTGASIPGVNVWTHVALVRNSGTVRLYINGVQLSSAAGSAVTVSSGSFDIGKSNDGTAYSTTSYISNFRYISGTCLYPSGTTFTPPTTPLTAVSGTAYLTLQSSQFVDNSTNAFTITNSSATNSTIQPFNPVVLTPAVPTINNSAQGQTSLATNNVGYYSGYFSGSSGLTDYVTVASSTVFSIAGVAAMFEFWFYPTASNIANSSDSIFQSYSYPNGYRLDWNGTNLSFYTVSGGTATCPFAASTYLYNWSFIQIKYTGTAVTFYINGVQTGTASQTVTITNVGTSSPFTFGIVPTYYTVRGYISNFRMSNVSTRTIGVPTAPFVPDGNTSLLTFQSSIFTDTSSNSLAITPTGKTQPSIYMPFPNTTGYWSGAFNGSSQYLYTTSASSNYALGSGAYTVEAWIYLTAASTSYGYGVLGTYPGSGGSGWSLTINRSTGNYGIYWISAGAASTTYGTLFGTNAWYHVAVVRTSTATNGLTIYINGVAVVTGTDTVNDSYSNYMYVANQGAGGQYFPGYISNVRFVKGTAVYTSNFTPPTTPLTAITNTQFLSCQNNTFIDNSTNAAAITNVSSSAATTFIPFTPPTPLSLGYATSAPITPSNYGSGYFGGSTSAITVANQPISTTANTFTVEAWIYPTATPTGTIPAVVGDNGSNYSNWSFGPTSSNTLQFYWYTSTAVTATGNTTIPLNAWTHIAVSVNASAISLYVNGTIQTITGTSTLSNRGTSGSTLAIGAFFAGSFAFTGYISNLRVVAGTALYTSSFIPPTAPLNPVTNTAVLTLQNKQSNNNTTFYDDSNNNFAITKTGTPAQGTFTPFEPAYSVYFPSGVYLAVPTLPAIPSSFTIEFWVNFPTTSLANTIFSSSSNLFIYVTSTIISYALDGVGDLVAATVSMVGNTWNHIAIVRNGTAITIYLNGVSVATGTNSTSWASAAAKIGLETGSSVDPFIGYLSNFRLVIGTAVYTSAFSPSAAPLTAIPNTTLLICQSNRFVDNSQNSYAITATGSPQVQAFNPFNPEYTYNPAVNGGSLYLNGTTDYLSIPSISGSVFGSNNFTIEGWYYFLSVSSPSYVVLWGMDNGASANPKLGLYINGGNLYVDIGSLGTIGVVGTNPFSIGQWYHVAFVRSGTGSNQSYIYINGVLKFTFTLSVSLSTITQPFNIGFLGEGSTSTFALNGYVSNFRITSNSALYLANFTPSTVPLPAVPGTSLLLNGTNSGLVDSTNIGDIYAVGTVAPYTQPNTVKLVNGSNSGAVYFSGSNYLALPNNAAYAFGAGNFTVECWINLASAGGGNVTLLSYNYQSATPSGNWALYLNGSGPYTLYFNSASANHSSTTTATISTGTWYHIAYCRSGTSGYFFVNGTQVGTTVTDSTSYTVSSAGPMYIGVMSNTTNYLTGYMQEARVTNGVARYTANFTPPAAVFPVI